MCQSESGACRNIGVIKRYHSPAAMRSGIAPRAKVTTSNGVPGSEGDAVWMTHMTTLIMRIVITTGAVARRAERTFGALRLASATHSGQCCPTEAGIAQRPQMGRSQREHLSLVGVSGCA
jgi:hypothetical protein